MYLSRNEVVIGILVFLVSAFVVAGFRWSIIHDSDAISPHESTSVFLHERADLEDLVQKLKESGVDVDQEQLSWVANMSQWRSFYEGHYLLDRGFSYHELLSKLAKGLQDPISLTIIPGRSEERIINDISARMKFDSLALQQTINDSSFLAEYNLTPKEVIGYLYPNTYDVYWTASPETALGRILDEFDRAVVSRYKDRLKDLDKSVKEVITMASIIEWEANNDEEKATISGLYWNRLDRGMRLQSDPTINYAVGERRRLHYKDYKVDHPYNTYLHDGLPPGPITNPGSTSIEAAFYPEDHDFLYMVASPEGDHAFSKTFEEHKEKSAQWRQWLQEQYRIKEQREANSN